MKTIRVGKVDDFEDPGKLVIDVGDEQYGVFRLGNDFFAWKNQCPHQGGPVCQGRIFGLVHEKIDDEKKSHGRDYVDGKFNIVCPWHGMEFDIKTGKFPGNPEMALIGIDVQVQGGDVYVVV